MNLVRTALTDVTKSNNQVVLVRGKNYYIQKDDETKKLFVQGDDGLFYLLEDHPDWFGDLTNILPFGITGI